MAFDGLGDGYSGAAIEALEPHGRLVLFGTSAGPDGQVPLRSLYRKGISVLGYAGLLESDRQRQAKGKVVLDITGRDLCPGGVLPG